MPTLLLGRIRKEECERFLVLEFHWINYLLCSILLSAVCLVYMGMCGNLEGVNSSCFKGLVFSLGSRGQRLNFKSLHPWRLPWKGIVELQSHLSHSLFRSHEGKSFLYSTTTCCLPHVTGSNTGLTKCGVESWTNINLTLLISLPKILSYRNGKLKTQTFPSMEFITTTKTKKIKINKVNIRYLKNVDGDRM